MAFKDRVVEFPGRIRLVPVAGEENVFDVIREEGAVTEQGTKLSAANLEANYRLISEERTGTVTYEAGTPGTRALAVGLGSSYKEGYRLIGLTILEATNASAYFVQPYVSAATSTIYAAIYRAGTNAVNGASIRVMATWAPVNEE